MRFTNLLTLLAATSALSYSVKRDGLEDLSKILEENGVSGEDIQKATNELNNLNGTDNINESNLIKVPDDLTDNLNGVNSDNLPDNLNGVNGNDLKKVAGEIQNNLNGTDQTKTLTTGNIPNLNGISNSGISEECMRLSTEYADCFGDPQNTQQTSNEEICNKSNTDKCKTLLKQDFSSVCGNELGGLFDFAISIYKLGCAKDENGKSCPQTKIFNDQDADISAKDIQDICSSKACTETALDGFTQLKKSISATQVEKDSKELEGYIKSLNECKATEDKKSSGTVQVKVGSALLATLALAFYLF